MRKWNFIVIVAFIAVLLGPIAMAGATGILHLSMPEWLSPSSAIWLQGGKSNSSIRGALNAEGISSGRLQNALEDKLEDYIPCKYTALLLPAELQRNAIVASNALSRWDCYPTYYGSNCIYIPSEKALSYRTFAPSDSLMGKLKEFADRLGRFAQAHADTNFCLVLADQSDISAVNPTRAFTPGVVSAEYYVSQLDEWLASAPNATVVTMSYEDEAAYYHDYYRSDHHWNGYGALKVYEKLAELYDLPLDGMVEEYDSAMLGLEGIVENGSYTRDGLMMVNEKAQEPALNLLGLTLESGVAGPVLDDSLADLLARGGAVEYNFYEAWYGYRGPGLFRSEVGKAENALLVCDSFGTALKYPLARAFARTDVAYDLHQDTKDASSLAEAIKETQPSTVFFVARLDNCANLLSRFPQYFDLEPSEREATS